MSTEKSWFREYGHHLFWHIAVWPTMGLLSWIVSWIHLTLYEPTKPASWIKYLNEHPLRIFFGLLAFGLIVQIGRRIVSALIKAKQYAAMVEGMGLREFSSHDTADACKADWERCKTQLTVPKPNLICILGATGWDTFASPQAPLHGVLKDFEGNVHILLIKPNSDGFRRRTLELQRREDEYLEQICDTLDFCKELSLKHAKSIEVRLYSDIPIWKMIFTNEYLWLQYYVPKRDVENTPVYTLQTRNPPTLSSLYYPLIRVFEKRWTDPDTLRINLSSWSRSKYHSLS